MKLNDLLLNKIVAFVKEESPTIYRLFKPHELRSRIRKHMEFNTIVVLWDGDEICAACIFNINESECEIHHAIVGKQYRYMDMLKRMVREGYLRYPWVTTLRFRRQLKYNDWGLRSYPIAKFLCQRSTGRTASIVGDTTKAAIKGSAHPSVQSNTSDLTQPHGTGYVHLV